MKNREMAFEDINSVSSMAGYIPKQSDLPSELENAYAPIPCFAPWLRNAFSRTAYLRPLAPMPILPRERVKAVLTCPPVRDC